MRSKRLQRIGAVALVAWLIAGQLLAGENLSGKWYVDAAGVSYNMELSQRGQEIFGRLDPLDTRNSLPIMLYGTVKGERFSAAAHDRLFFITLQLKGTVIGDGLDQTIHGRLKLNGRHNYRWYAIRSH